MAAEGTRTAGWVDSRMTRQFDARTWRLEELDGRYYVRDMNGELLGRLMKGNVPFTSMRGKTEDGEIARGAEPEKFAKALASLKKREEDSIFPLAWVEMRLLSVSEQEEIKARIGEKTGRLKKLD